MPLIYITGISGAGKTAVCDALRERGYTAYDMDRDGFKSWYDRATDKRAVDQPRWIDATREYRRRYWLAVDPEKVEALAAQAGFEHGPVFLCGITAGEEKVWHLFDTVVHLSIGGGNAASSSRDADGQRLREGP